MNTALKKALAVLLAAPLAFPALPALASYSGARGAEYAAMQTDTDGDFKTVCSRSGKRIFSVSKAGGGFTAEITAAGAAGYGAAVYAVTADGEETPLGNADAADGAVVTVTADAELLPDNAVRADVRILSGGTEKTVYSLPVTQEELWVPDAADAQLGWQNSVFGAHDPSIVKFDGDNTYYAYSSHHIIFTSEDLINWKKYNFANRNVNDMAPETCRFIADNIDAGVNGTYWAPDVIYDAADADTPYHMYISVSCGLGGRNSAIGLVKSSSPLFWADDSAVITDAGVVFATKEDRAYATNAIDANIYTDKNGKRYFIWGSFWGGIQGAEMTEDGRVKGVDYSSDAAVLSSCTTVGKTLFSQKNGTAGPEGAWVTERGAYRYMFTSYGWLGSNYNTRVARSPLSADALSAYTDANGVDMSKEFTEGGTSVPTGYKLIGSYRLGGGASDIIKRNGDNFDVRYTPGDAHIYYGPGHNSVLKAADDEYYYVSHVRKDGVEGAAYLQVRKMLWTEDGWPVVSPVSYTGEREQTLPKALIVGAYDLAAAGYTKTRGTEVSHRGSDLPVVSSRLVLSGDESVLNDLGDTVGAWSYDGYHTVTISFTADGDAAKDEFFKNGDTLVMAALLSYDRDAGKYVMALTGTDENHIAQFAVKDMDAEPERTVPAAEAVTVPKSKGNPALGFDGSGVMYAGDPAALVDGDTVYIYAGHDTAATEAYCMPEWVCYSSKNMTDWKYEGAVMKATDVSWRNDDTSAWASQAVKYNGKYYLYFCTWDKTSSGKQSIGVAVSDSPTGPFVDKGSPIVKGTDTAPETSAWNDIDPTVWIETDENGIERRYLAWGNGKLYLCELNEDMVSVKGGIKEQTITHVGTNRFTEAPWLYRRQDENGVFFGPYYMFFAQNWREEMGYATADDLSGGKWRYRGRVMTPTATSNTNHPSVIDFGGKTYFIYHNGMLSKGSGFRRSVCIQEIGFDAYGNVYPITEMSVGLTGTAQTVKASNSKFLSHDGFENTPYDADYPIIGNAAASGSADGLNAAWEIVRGLYQPENESYVSVQAVNKPGLYIKEDAMSVVLTQDTDGLSARSMTFKTVKALDGSDGVSFESVSRPGRFLTVNGNAASLSFGDTPEDCSFVIGSEFNRAVLSDCVASDGFISFKITGGAVYKNAVVYAAEYTPDKTLAGAAAVRTVISSDNQLVSVKYEKKSKDNSVKLFLWDNMTPVAEPAAVNEETPQKPAVPAGYTSHFAFDGDLTDSVTGEAGTLTGSKADAAASAAAQYADSPNGKAISFTGAGSYGVSLGNVVKDSKYTVSFKFSARAFTQYTPAIFIANDIDNWVSAPIGCQTDKSMMLWSKNNSGYMDLTSPYIAEADGTWYTFTVTADGENAVVYVNGARVTSGRTADIMGANTKTYLGVNFWDTPFNGLIDELYIYSGAVLTDAQVADLYNATK